MLLIIVMLVVCAPTSMQPAAETSVLGTYLAACGRWPFFFRATCFSAHCRTPACREIEQEEKARLEKASKKASKKQSKKQQKGKQEEEVKEAGPVPLEHQGRQQAGVVQQQREQQQGVSPLLSTASPCRCPLPPANHLTRCAICLKGSVVADTDLHMCA